MNPNTRTTRVAVEMREFFIDLSGRGSAVVRCIRRFARRAAQNRSEFQRSVSGVKASDVMNQAEYVQEPDDQKNRDQSIQNAPDGGLHGDEVVYQPHQDSDDDQGDDNLDQRHIWFSFPPHAAGAMAGHAAGSGVDFSYCWPSCSAAIVPAWPICRTARMKVSVDLGAETLPERMD